MLACLFDRNFHQIADDRLNIATNIANFGEFRRFNLQKGGVGQLGQATSNFGFTHPGGTNHQDVLRGDFIAQDLIN